MGCVAHGITYSGRSVYSVGGQPCVLYFATYGGHLDLLALVSLIAPHALDSNISNWVTGLRLVGLSGQRERLL